MATVQYKVGPDGKVELRAPDGSVVSLPEAEARERIVAGWDPADRAGAGEAFLRGAASASTFGLSEALVHDDAAFRIAQLMAEGRKAAARIVYDAAKASGDVASQLQAEQALQGFALEAEDLKRGAKDAETYQRSRSAQMFADHPIASIGGELVGMLNPVGPIGTIGKAAGALVKAEKGASFLRKAASTALRFGSEGVAMGLEGGIVEGAVEGEYNAGKIATKVLEGAAINSAFGLGGLGLSTVIGKAWRGGGSAIVGKTGEEIVAAGKRLRQAEQELAGLSSFASKQPEIAAELSDLRRLYDEGALKGVMPGRAVEDEMAARSKLDELAGRQKALSSELDASVAARRRVEMEAERVAAETAAAERDLAIAKAAEERARAAEVSVRVIDDPAEAKAVADAIGDEKLSALTKRQRQSVLSAERKAAAKERLETATKNAVAAQERLNELLKQGADLRHAQRIVKEEVAASSGLAAAAAPVAEKTVMLSPAAAKAEAQRKAIAIALMHSGGNQSKAAELLGVSRKHVNRTMVEVGIGAGEGEAALRAHAGLAADAALPAAAKLEESVLAAQKDAILAALEAAMGSATRAGEMTGLSQKAVKRFIDRFGIDQKAIERRTRPVIKPGKDPSFKPEGSRPSTSAEPEYIGRPVAYREVPLKFGGVKGEAPTPGAPADIPPPPPTSTALVPYPRPSTALVPYEPPPIRIRIEPPAAEAAGALRGTERAALPPPSAVAEGPSIPDWFKHRAPHQVQADLDRVRREATNYERLRANLATENAAQSKLGKVVADMRKAGYEGSNPVNIWMSIDEATQKIADGQAAVMGRAAKWFNGGRIGLGVLGGGIGFASGRDFHSGVVGGIAGLLSGMVASKIGGAVATRMARDAMSRLPGALPRIEGAAAGIAKEIGIDAARLTTAAIVTMKDDDFREAADHVKTLASVAPDIQRASEDALVLAGVPPELAPLMAARRAAGLQLLAAKAQANDKVGFLRTLDALSNPHGWYADAKAGKLRPETWSVMQSLAPAACAQLSTAAKQVVADPRLLRKLPAAQRRMIQMLAGGGVTVGSIQQNAFAPEKPGPAPAAKKMSVPPTSSEGLEQRYMAAARQ